ncbi:uncharacterized protein PAE49_001430 [Odontesthes bonariensis]|uniref:uncharacterized protein LOC142373889 n=1 Tax=Odontesthes bonariensis TaxID=219752 RepID=UPI003F581BAB
MGGGKYLLLLPAFVLVVRCQPQVSMFPSLKQIFIGDSFKLSCNDNPSGSAVKWFLNDTILKFTEKIQRIAVAAPNNSGSYHCESNGRKSENFPIHVIEYTPIASLTLETGQPVMSKGGSVILKLKNEDGLKEWNCWVTRGNTTRKIHLKLQNDSMSLFFQPNKLAHPETIFWCTDKLQSHRSNQITIRTSGKSGALEMYPLPAVAGRSLTLKCLVWGAKEVSDVEFYKDGSRIHSVKNHYEIKDVMESQMGKYRCHAKYRYNGQIVESHHLVSDDQEVPVQVSPVEAKLSEDMLCSCPSCVSDMWPRFYETNGLSWTDSKPDSYGTYQCRFVSNDMGTLFSKSVVYKPPSNPLFIIMVLVVMIVIIAALVACVYFYKKRDTTEPIYQDVPLRSQGDAKYETLQKARGRESEYDTLNPEASGGERKGGEYEALKKEGMQEGVYHSLGAQGAAGGDGGYEALKKEGMQEGVYHSLGDQGAVGGDGGYEALKKEGMKDGEYQTLKTKEAVKKP